MIEQIGEKLAEIVEPIVPFFFSEAETEEYPYAVYTKDVTPVPSKDGIHKLRADVTVEVYAKDYDEAVDIAEEIRAAVLAGMRDEQFSVWPQLHQESRSEGIWISRTDYIIKQIS